MALSVGAAPSGADEYLSSALRREPSPAITRTPPAASTCAAVLRGHSQDLCAIVHSKTGVVYSADSAGEIRAWRTADGACTSTSSHDGRVVTLQLSGNSLISASTDATVCVWDSRTTPLKLLFALPGHCGGATCATPTSTGDRLFVGAADGVIRIWDLSTGSAIAQMHGHEAPVVCLQAARDGNSLFSASADGSIRGWCTGGNGLLMNCHMTHFLGHTAHVSHLLLSRDGSTLYSAARDGGLRAWSTADGACAGVLATLPESESTVSLVLSGDGERLWSGHEDGTVRLWLTGARKCAATAKAHARPAALLQLSRSEEVLASASADGTVRVCAADSLQCQAVAGPTLSCDPVLAMALSKDGRELWTGGAGGALRKWIIGPPQPFSRGVCLNFALATTKHRTPGCMPANLTNALGLLVAAATDKVAQCVQNRRLVQRAEQLASAAGKYATGGFSDPGGPAVSAAGGGMAVAAAIGLLPVSNGAAEEDKEEEERRSIPLHPIR